MIDGDHASTSTGRRRSADGLLGYAREFVESWFKTASLSVRVWREGGFDVIQACNPPDTYWALAALYKPFGVRFVFDQHDLNPELFLSRFGEPSGSRRAAAVHGRCSGWSG